MLKLLIDKEASNKLCLPATVEDLTAFCQVLIDLHSGTKVLFSDFVATLPSIGNGNATLETDTTALFKSGIFKYLVVEVRQVSSGSPHGSSTEKAFEILQEFLASKIPSLYKEILQSAISTTNLESVFNKKTIVLFQFRNEELEIVSTVPYYKSINDYIQQVSIRKELLKEPSAKSLENLLDANNKDGCPSLFVNCSARYNSYNSSYNYYGQASISKACFFIKKDYFRFNALEWYKNKLSLIFVGKRTILESTYSCAEGYSNLISAIINPSSMNENFSKPHFGNCVLMGQSPICLTLKKQLHPVIVVDSNLVGDGDLSLMHSAIELSDDDAEFLEAVKNVDSSLIYTKHKCLISELGKSEIRGCKAIYNSSKTLKVVIRDEKKKTSDEEAYKNRILRDYLSHAISLIAIPIFQKEFVVPDCLQQSFVFKMASLDGCWYKQQYNGGRLQHSDRYWDIFNPANKTPGVAMPLIPTSTQVKSTTVSSFIESYKKMEVSSSTQSKSSVFTRYFVEPFVEKTDSSYAPPSRPTMFGWMMALDNQDQTAWASKKSNSHLMRSCPKKGQFYHECGLVSDKTFGIQAILSLVFVRSTVTSQYKDYSVQGARVYLDEEKKNFLISSVLDIYTANFTPNDRVEYGIRSYGGSPYSTELARVNQLLFLSEPSLNIFKALYSCTTFEELATCLDLCMPICLEMLDTLDYSKELKAHVSEALRYFWNTTNAISKELSGDTAKK